MTATEFPPQHDQPARTLSVGQPPMRWLRCPGKALLWLVLAAGSADAQTLREAVERAWERQPAAQARSYRSAELAARTKAANAWLPSPPSIGLSERSDRFNRNGGAREVAAELSFPL